MLDWAYKTRIPFVKKLIILAITVIGLLSVLDVALGYYSLFMMRIAAVLGLSISYYLVNKNPDRGIKLSIGIYTAFQIAYTIFYYRLPETGTWLVIYALALALITDITTTVIGSSLVFSIYAYLLIKAGDHTHFHIASSLLQTAMATAVAIIISSYYNRQIDRSTKKLIKTAQQDYLTGLYSRRFLLDALKQQVRRYRNTGTPFSAILIDLDNFKEINDTKGHLYGDKILRTVGKIIKTNLRKTDIPIRYGGDEFIIILPDTDINGAYKVAEKLSHEIKRTAEVTSSIGVFCYKEAQSIEDFLTRLDEACYSAKNKGKDRIETA